MLHVSHAWGEQRVLETRCMYNWRKLTSLYHCFIHNGIQIAYHNYTWQGANSYSTRERWVSSFGLMKGLGNEHIKNICVTHLAFQKIPYAHLGYICNQNINISPPIVFLPFSCCYTTPNLDCYEWKRLICDHELKNGLFNLCLVHLPICKFIWRLHTLRQVISRMSDVLSMWDNVLFTKGFSRGVKVITCTIFNQSSTTLKKACNGSSSKHLPNKLKESLDVSNASSMQCIFSRTVFAAPSLSCHWRTNSSLCCQNVTLHEWMDVMVMGPHVVLIALERPDVC